MGPTSRRRVRRAAIGAAHRDATATLRDLLTDPPLCLTLLSPLPTPIRGAARSRRAIRAKDPNQLGKRSERSCHRNASARLLLLGSGRRLVRPSRPLGMLVRQLFTGPARHLPPINHIFTGSERLFTRPQTLGCYISITETANSPGKGAMQI